MPSRATRSRPGGRTSMIVAEACGPVAFRYGSPSSTRRWPSKMLSTSGAVTPAGPVVRLPLLTNRCPKSSASGRVSASHASVMPTNPLTALELSHDGASRTSGTRRLACSAWAIQMLSSIISGSRSS
jgi:hypothetical protein